MLVVVIVTYNSTVNIFHGVIMRQMKRRVAGMERLQDIVTTRRKMAGHILRQHRERPTHIAMYWVSEDGRRKRGRPKKT